MFSFDALAALEVVDEMFFFFVSLSLSLATQIAAEPNLPILLKTVSSSRDSVHQHRTD